MSLSARGPAPTHRFPSALVPLSMVWLAACGSADVSTPARPGDAGANDAQVPPLDAQVTDGASGPSRDAAGSIGSFPGTRDAETTIAVCGAQANRRCPDDAAVADAAVADAGVVTPGRCEGDAGRGCGDVSCDVRQAMCKRAPPVCVQGEVPSVVDTCFGDCVRLEQCVCHAAEECPVPDQGTCHMSAAHCGPYVN